ncbi:PIG-L family deacetylase [Streptomyces sp. NPDC008317]|uniref:PIG-L family deacetylase n=1 Tax=Streptomyces sp. NPDC008317 TaxID=3364827 RepID=UPI0036E6B983
MSAEEGGNLIAAKRLLAGVKDHHSPDHPSRRSLLTAAVATAGATAAAAALSGCTSQAQDTAPRRLPAPADPLATQPYRPQGDPLVLQVMAHPDDDLFFMNPDTLHSLQAGTPVVSVYVTAGESTGVNHEPFGPRRRHRRDQAAYSSSRHQGLRQAYATMLGLPHFTRWTTDVIDVGGGLHAEVDELRHGAMHARLVFLQVSMHELSSSASLPMMWEVPGTVLSYVVAQNAPAPANGRGTYTHQKLVDVLAGLMERFRPTEIRTLDPDPDIQVHDKRHPAASEQPGFSDHRDHTATALFTWKAMAQWVSESANGPGRAVPAFSTTAYRGYYNHHWPYNLPPATVALKARFLFQYGGNQAWRCGNPGGCGDYGQGENEPLANPKGWIRSTHRRYPGARRIVVGGAAYEVLGTRAVRREETRPGSGVWGPPQDLGGGTLAPALSCVRTRDGGTLLFALRFAVLEGHGGPNTRDIVMWRDGGWSSLGSPETHPDRTRRTGAPVAVAAPDGTVHLFARNAAKGVSTRVLTAGVWSPWRDLGGAEVQDGLAVVTDRRGRIHVFASGHTTVHHWAQSKPGGAVAYAPLPALPAPGGLPSAALTPSGPLSLRYTLPATPRVFHQSLAL